MNKLFYPAIFHKAEEGGYWITFPDIPECITEGDTIEQAYAMAFDALGLCLSECGKDIPNPSVPESINIEHNCFLVVVQFDLAEYRKKHGSRAVKKTLTIPEWLNEEAIARNINFSQVLQDALMKKIN